MKLSSTFPTNPSHPILPPVSSFPRVAHARNRHSNQRSISFRETTHTHIHWGVRPHSAHSSCKNIAPLYRTVIPCRPTNIILRGAALLGFFLKSHWCRYLWRLLFVLRWLWSDGRGVVKTLKLICCLKWNWNARINALSSFEHNRGCCKRNFLLHHTFD